MTKVKFYLPILAVLFFAFAVEAQTVKLKGTIGESRFQMALTRAGEELSGTYFYDKQGSANKLSLKGKIDAKGNFTLEETDAAGRLTGTFKGTWKNDETTSGVELQGTWRKPKGGSPDGLGFYAVQQNIHFTRDLSLVSRKVEETNKLKFFEMSGEYPEITGAAAAGNPDIAKFNLLAKQTVAKSLADFRKEMMAQTAEDIKFSKERGVSNYIEIGYDTEYAADDFVSLQFSTSTYTGGVHPNSFAFTINYDLKNGRELSLADLFQPKSNYLKIISDYCIKDLKTRVEEMSDDEWLGRGAGPEAENFANWNITEKGLLINFDPYQVAAYAAGPQMVIIPYEKLKSVLKPDSVVYNLRK